MIRQTTKACFLFVTLLFVIMAAFNYFSGDDVYYQLIVTAFLVHFVGDVAYWWQGYHIERRKRNIAKTDIDRMPWMFQRQAD